MKITTKPEKWFIEITNENRPHLEKYWEKLPNLRIADGFAKGIAGSFLLSEPYDYTYQFYGRKNDFKAAFKGYIELNFKEFQELVWKPYKGRKVTVNMVKSHPYFRSLTVDELRDVIGNDMDHSEYLKLPGRLAYDKAQTLAATFAKQEVGEVEKADGKEEVRKFNPEKWNILCHNFEQAYLVFKYVKPRCGQDFKAQIKHIKERTDLTYPIFIECDLEQGECGWEFGKYLPSNLTRKALSRQITFEEFSSLTGNEPFDPENWNIVVSTREQVKAVTSYLADKLQDESIRHYLDDNKLPLRVRFIEGNDWWGYASIENMNENFIVMELYPIERQITFHQFLTLTNKPIEHMEFILPDKWCILRTPETCSVINQHFNKKSRGSYDSNYDWIYSEKVTLPPCPHVDGSFDRDPANPKHKGFTPITFEQFEKHVLNQKTMDTTMTDKGLSFDPLNWNMLLENAAQGEFVVSYLIEELGEDLGPCDDLLNGRTFPHLIRRTGKTFGHNPTNFNGNKDIESRYDPKYRITFEQLIAYLEMEIEGYICPMDMFNGNVDAGTIYVHFQTKNGGVNYYNPKGRSDYAYTMPEEIVKTWKPKFKGSRYKPGTYVRVISGGEGAYGANDECGVVIEDTGFNSSGGHYDEYRGNPVLKIGDRTWRLCDGFQLEIITEAEYKKSLVKLPAIGGYEGKVDEDARTVVYGCQKFAIENVVELKNIMDKNGIYSINLTNRAVTHTQIKDIVKYLETYNLIQ